MDPLASVVALLRPRPAVAKVVEAGGRWRVERSGMASPFYAAIVEGRARLSVKGRAPLMLDAGDFVLIPDLDSFSMESDLPPPPGASRVPLETGPGRVRVGPEGAPVEMRALVGHCRFATVDRALLLSLLPEVIHVPGQERLMALVPVIHDETRSDRPARLMILERLLEVMMIEALRSGPGPTRPPGLLRGLADPRLIAALHRIHSGAASGLTVAGLAREAGLSRSTFFERFRTALGCAPMEYAATWRMAVARDLLLRGGLTNAEIAHRVGYGSASAFGMAFARHQGMSPGAFVARHAGEEEEALSRP
ncbi:AraC family transcriptional regulator (plasmid) [Paroceanicella profunda]|uniref:AraC family transcriptional regulator n=2 Tax=Paroceanicella profunda TaxID=2579971 RepID=A0A5B8FIY3_9RHOB|nr:AraC family transcriptional regulator [Paroceanicella profunda]